MFTEWCCFWPWKRFEWSKSLLLRFPSSYELNPPSKISHPPPLRGIPLPPPLFGKPCPEACRDMYWVMVLEQSTHYNFPFKFSFQYVDISWYRLLPILVPSCSPISYTWCPPWWGERCSPPPLWCLWETLPPLWKGGQTGIWNASCWLVKICGVGNLLTSIVFDTYFLEQWVSFSLHE